MESASTSDSVPLPDSKSDSFVVLQTWHFDDDFKIEQISKSNYSTINQEVNNDQAEVKASSHDKVSNDQAEVKASSHEEEVPEGDEDLDKTLSDGNSTQEQDGDDASTVVLDDNDTAERLNALIEENIESLYPQTETGKDQKLEPIVEEIPPVNEEAEETYEGAAGLWAQTFELPCFKSKTFDYTKPKIQKMEVQRSSVYDWVQSAPAANWCQDQSPFYVAPVVVQSVQVERGAKPKVCATIEDIVKLSEDNIVFTKEPADCAICKRPMNTGQGVVLKDCLHTFCRRCLVHAISDNQNKVMLCPSQLVQCQGEVRDEEIRALLNPEAYEKYIHEMLVRMEITDLAELHYNYEYVENKYDFHCEICLKDIVPGDGIVLKKCIHQYCKPCLTRYIETSDEVDVPCPFRAEDGTKCVGSIMDSEVRSLVPQEVYRGILEKSVAQAEASNPNAYHCKTPDCPAWVEIEGEIDRFNCGACKRDNCVKCKAVHQGVTCEDYQDMVHGPDRRARENAATEDQVRSLIARKDAQPCPRCGIITQRISGCRHMTCTKCRHEFQWTGRDLQ